MSRTKSKARDFSKMKSGTSAGDMVQLDASGRLPAVDGSLLTGIEGVPSGIIAMWSGTNASIPTGWNLCDGTNGTPDLRDRFIVGSGSTYSTGDTGGADSVTLTEAQMPSHTHDGSSLGTNTTGAHSHTFQHNSNPSGGWGYQVTGSALANWVTVTTSTAGNHSHSITGNTGSAGSGAAHENRPPYYALAYIMKS